MTEKKDRTQTGGNGDQRPEQNEGVPMLESLFGSGVGSLLGGLVDVSGQAVKMASGTALEQAYKLFKYTPGQLERMGRAGTALKDAREVAGLTIAELSSAIDLKNPDLLKLVEQGKIALPFETLLRLASFYARNDPIPFIMKYARTYSPGAWEVMQAMGLDKLTLEAEREIQFINIYRSHDAARDLSDEGFDRVLDFTRKAFEMALHFVAEQEGVDVEDDEQADEQLGQDFEPDSEMYEE